MAVSSWQRRPPSHRRSRRGIRLWLLEHAWQLSGMTALVSAFSFSSAISYSFFKRPRLPYFFPLLSDVSARDPERTILHSGFMCSTLLLIATTIACWELANMLEEGCEQSLEEFLDTGTNGNGHVQGVRRVRMLGITSGLIIFTGILLFFTFARSFEFIKLVAGVLTARKLDAVVWYILAFLWFSAISFLAWFFFKLETIPDHDAEDPEEQRDYFESALSPRHDRQEYIKKKLHEYFIRLILYLRPLCFAGQVICLVKIAGLRFALDRFSISQRGLTRLMLQTALSFTEYTSAFFFSFFMVMLAIDIRKKFRPKPEVQEVPPVGYGDLGSPLVARSPMCK